MNCKEWRYLRDNHKELLDFTHYNNTRKIQKSLKYNSNPNATLIHHLRDTEEQRKYNDEHYELWGHNLDGSFEYGKYVTFVTEEWHTAYHSQSEETRAKRSVSMKEVWADDAFRNNQLTRNPMFCDDHSGENHHNYGKHLSDEMKNKISKSETGKIVSDETRNKISVAGKGRTSPNKGITLSLETRKKISENTRAAMTDEVKKRCSEAHKGIKPSDETRRKMSESAKRRVDDDFCKKMSILQSERMTEEYKKHLSEEMRNVMHHKKELYKQYKNNGGTLLWNDFQKYIKDNNLLDLNN